jgi:hypothetical protein
VSPATSEDDVPARFGRVRRGLILAALACASTCSRDRGAPTTEPSESSESAPSHSPALLDAPVDPLANMDDAARWRWALERVPGLARPDRAPAPDFTRFGATGKTVELFSPDFAEHMGLTNVYEPCEPMELAIQPDRLVTRVPTAGGGVWPKAPGAHLVLELGHELRLGGGTTGAAPLLSELTSNGLRYEGTTTGWTVACAGEGKLLRTCGDGTTDECPFCELTVVPQEGGGPVEPPTANHPEGPCPPCPADDHGHDRVPIARVAHEQPYLVIDPATGPVFFRSLETCKAFAKPSKKKKPKPKKKPPPKKKTKKKKKVVLKPLPKGRTHGMPLHPALVLECDMVVTRSGGSRAAAAIYATTLSPTSIARWYGIATGIDGVGEGARTVLRRDDVTIEIGAPKAFEGDRCVEPSAGAQTFVRVSTAF